MSSTSKLVKQFSWHSNKMFSTTPGHNKTMPGVDRETMDTLYTDNWAKRDNNMSVKDEIKLMVKDELSRAKQEQWEGTSKAWTQFQCSNEMF